jgi:copper transport protein
MPIALGALLATLGLLWHPLVLFAHAHLRRSEPAARAQLVSPPTAIRLWFSERPELAFTRIRLLRADSTEVSLGKAASIARDALGVESAIPSALDAGRYIVLWQTAGADGHPSRGSFEFSVVGRAQPVAAMHDSLRSPAPATHALVRVKRTEPMSIKAYAATRWLEFIGVLSIVGAVVFRLLIASTFQGQDAPPLAAAGIAQLSDAARRVGQGALVLLLIADVARLYTEASAMAGNEEAIGVASITALLRTTWGTGWLVGVAGLLVAAAGLTAARRTAVGWTVALIGALGVVVEPALTGHAAAESSLWLAVVGDALHVAAISAWLGTLLVLVLVGIPTARRAWSDDVGSGGLAIARLARAYHPVALVCAAVMILSGLLSTWLHLPSLPSLWQTGYGRVLLGKLAFVVLVLVLGALNWRRVLPSLGGDEGAQRLRRRAGVELGLVAIVLALTAILVSSETPT